MDYFIIAVLLGSTYALIALGYSLVYRSLRLINFAHGEFCTVGAYCTWLLVTRYHFHGWLGITLGILAGGGIAVLAWYVAYKPLRFASRTTGILAALGISICIQQLLARIFGAQSKAFPEILTGSYVKLGEVNIDALSIFTIICTVLLFLSLHLIWQHTRWGLMIRAVADDWESAECAGINAGRMIMLTFLIAGLAAGLSGVVLAASFGRVEPSMGFGPSIKAFVAALVFGLDSPKGAALGGLLLGLGETFTVAAGLSSYRDAVVLTFLVVLIILRARKRTLTIILPGIHSTQEE